VKDLKAIIGLLTKQKIKQIEILSESSKLSEKSRILYEGIQAGTITNDDEAAFCLYGENAKSAKYRVLKNRFKQRLINTLFFIDVQAYGKVAYDRIKSRSYKNWAAAKILYDKGLSTNSISLMKIILQSTLKYDLTELSVLVLRDIKLHYGLYNYDKNKFQKYDALFEELNLIQNYKVESEKYYIILGHIVETNKSATYDSKIIEIEKKLNALSKKAMLIDSYYLRYNLYISHYIIHLIKKDFKNQLSITENAIEYFNNKKGFKQYGVVTFTQISGLIQLSLKNFDKSYEAFQQCLKFKPKEGRLFWQSLHNYIFLIHILKKDYRQSYRILSYVVTHKTFKNIYNDFRQQWLLKEAFIQFLIRIKKIEPENIDAQKLKKFRIKKFLNEIPSLTKDKRGFNIAIHIVQMLFLIIDEQYDDLLDKLSSLKQYSFRYLKSEEYLRSRIFIKMLLTIPESSYNIVKIKSKTKTLHQKLIATPMDFSEQAMSIEIIPYEQLWEEVIGLLER